MEFSFYKGFKKHHKIEMYLNKKYVNTMGGNG